MVQVNGTKCDDCNHRLVCRHKNDFNNIYKSVSESIGKVIDYDILSDIIVNCRYYYKEVSTPRWQNGTNTLTNPCGHSISTTMREVK